MSLKDLAKEIDDHARPIRLTVRELLASEGHARRGKHVMRKISAALKKYKLVSEPDFNAVHIDSAILLKKKTNANSGRKHIAREDAPNSSISLSSKDDSERDVLLTIGQLDAANKTPVFITKSDKIEKAITLLMQHDVSHLVVSQNQRQAEGLVSWKSIGQARASRHQDKSVLDCMERHPVTLSYSSPLFDAVRDVVNRGAVIVKNSENLISGLVTPAEIAQQFISLSEPFLYLEQCESHLREMLRKAAPKIELLREMVDPRDENRKGSIKEVDDLTFGETIRAIGDERIWPVLNLALDRKTFIAGLDDIRDVRNTVMHFHPDGISNDEQIRLHKTRRMLQIL